VAWVTTRGVVDTGGGEGVGALGGMLKGLVLET
jgi:hypothetical protein